MAKKTMTVKIKVDGVKETVAALRALPKVAKKELADRTKDLAKELADKVKESGTTDSAPQSADVARTVRVAFGANPAISMGGTRRVGRRRTPAYKVMFGAVFGSNEYKQFGRVHAGPGGSYWFFDVVEREGPRIASAWQEVADGIVDEFSASGAVE